MIKNQSSPFTFLFSNGIFIRISILTLLLVWCTGFLIPIIISKLNPVLVFFLSDFYSRVCHQESLKCISIGEDHLLVCARCAGLYFGGLFAGISSLFITVPVFTNRILLLSLLPLIADVIFTTLGVYSYSQPLSLATGILAGLIIYLFLISESEKIFQLQMKPVNE